MSTECFAIHCQLSIADGIQPLNLRAFTTAMQFSCPCLRAQWYTAISPYFVSSAKAIIPVACGAENDVPCSPSTQEEAKDVDVCVDI